MKTFKDKKVIFLAIILVVFTIGYFVIVNKVSYAFSDNYDLEMAYDNIIKTIEECAVAYGKKHPDLFNEENIIYIKVQDLIDNDFLVANKDGNIQNPLKKNETLNTNIIKIKKDQDNISVEVDS